MKKRILLAAPALLCALAPGRAQASAPAACEMPSARGIGAVYDELSRRAIEVVERAAASGWQNDVKLRALVASDAEFSLGSGDVGRPLGKGPAGARALGGDIKADSFRYLAWSSIPTEIDPCAEWSVRVEFIDSRTSTLANMEFKFRAGVLVSAEGCSQWYVAGQLKPAANR